MVLLIGNYGPDQQQSMQRFGTMMLEGLTAAGVSAELIQPEPVFGEIRFAGGVHRQVARVCGQISPLPAAAAGEVEKRPGPGAYLRSFERDVFPARRRNSGGGDLP